jgi:hypothetical protein
MRGASFWLLAGSTQQPATTHCMVAQRAVAAARALEEEDGGGWAGCKAIGPRGWWTGMVETKEKLDGASEEIGPKTIRAA